MTLPTLDDIYILHEANCPACGHHVAISFFDGGRQPLATIAWPSSAQEACSMPRLPLSFVRCVNCSHVFNREFDYQHVPYSDKPNLMYNRSVIWKRHLGKTCDLLLSHLPDNPTIVEIGCGEGHLLRAMAEACPGGRFIGFDPNGTVDTADGRVEARMELFEPAIHLQQYRPDMVISRHVLEHLMNPLRFLQRLSFVAGWLEMDTLLFLEVPCIDRVFETGRVADFYYEHNSHFTTRSFTSLLQQCSKKICMLEHGYNDEVIAGLVLLGANNGAVELGRDSVTFRDRAIKSRELIARQLGDLYTTGRSVAFWGGTGKGAAFINYYGADAERFPIVVDSDSDKVGTFVPGTGQVIRFRDYLKEHPADIILIPTQWRAKDIVLEMEQVGICYDSVLIEHGGCLTDYFKDEHPY